MKFQLRPILSEIKDLYKKPISSDRFKDYIAKLKGSSKSDMQLPISGFNPMAKEHILQKIEELENLDAEKIMRKTIAKINQETETESDTIIDVVLNLADDKHGAWTNFYATDFDSKFKLSAFVNRNFCTPFFWTSKSYDEKLIQNRTRAYINRTRYWLQNPKPKTLADHFNQEVFVFKNASNKENEYTNSQFKTIESYLLKNKASEAHDVIFNFLYGDTASESLGYKKYGIKGSSGLDYAKFVAMTK